MPSKIHVHPTMLNIIHSIYPRSLKRSDLIAKAMKFDDYKTLDKAEKFISRQVHRLNRLRLITPRGTRNSRWYELTETMEDYLAEKVCDGRVVKKSIFEKLAADEVKLEKEISLVLSELEEMKALASKYPVLANEAEMIISNELDRKTILIGRLSAIKKLKGIAKKSHL